MTFEEFSQPGNKLRNAHIHELGIVIYVRRSQKISHTADFELASLDADKPGNGALTAFLDKYESQFTFYIENILNERLLGYFSRRGYHLIGGGKLPDNCMISEGCTHIYDRPRDSSGPGM